MRLASCLAAVTALGAAVLLMRLQGQPQIPEGAAPVDADVRALIEEEANLAGLAGSPSAAAPVGERIEASGLETASAVGTFDAEASTPLAARWIRGRVLLPGGKPAGGALVTLLEMRDGQGLSSGRHTLAKADGLGAFEIAVPPWSWQQVVHLSARRRGSRPFSKALQIDSSALGERHELTLEVGSVLEGRVLRGGAALEGVHVNVDVAYGVPGIYGAGPESWWANGRMERKHGSTQTDANGYFRIAGLSAAAHRVHLHEPGTPASRRGDHVFSIEAPDSRIYDVTGATLAVQVVSSTGAVEGARIVGTLDDGRVEVTSGLGAVELDVPPGATVSLSVEHPRAAATSQVVVAPPAGQWLEVTVPVQMVERPRLVVTMTGMGTRRVDAVRLRFRAQYPLPLPLPGWCVRHARPFRPARLPSCGSSHVG